ncbi:unnamed protein product [Closterium sp. NIES-54]
MPLAPRLKQMAPPAAVPAPLQPEEQKPRAVEMDTAPSPVLLSRSRTPYPPQEEPTASAYGSHEQQQMQREQEEDERLTGEEEVQAHRAQPEEGTHVLERCAASCSGSSTRFAPVASHQKQHAIDQPSLLADHMPSRHHDRAPPTSHHDRHGMQPSSPGTHGAEENRVAAASSLARHVAQGSQADAAGGPETADAEPEEQQRVAQDKEPPRRPAAAPMSPQSVGREPTAQRPPPPPLGPGC